MGKNIMTCEYLQNLKLTLLPQVFYLKSPSPTQSWPWCCHIWLHQSNILVQLGPREINEIQKEIERHFPDPKLRCRFYEKWHPQVEITDYVTQHLLNDRNWLSKQTSKGLCSLLKNRRNRKTTQLMWWIQHTSTFHTTVEIKHKNLTTSSSWKSGNSSTMTATAASGIEDIHFLLALNVFLMRKFKWFFSPQENFALISATYSLYLSSVISGISVVSMALRNLALWRVFWFPWNDDAGLFLISDGSDRLFIWSLMFRTFADWVLLKIHLQIQQQSTFN